MTLYIYIYIPVLVIKVELLNIHILFVKCVCLYHLLHPSAVLFQQYLTTFMFGIGAAQMIISGIKSVEGMHNPIFTCSSPSDFWGKKWNLIIHGALKINNIL